MAQQPPVVQGLLIVEPSRSHSDTPHSVGLLWTSDQPYAGTSQQYSRETDIHAPGVIRTRNPSKRASADPCPKPRGHWDRLQDNQTYVFIDMACVLTASFDLLPPSIFGDRGLPPRGGPWATSRAGCDLQARIILMWTILRQNLTL